jgi:hypothetical protein
MSRRSFIAGIHIVITFFIIVEAESDRAAMLQNANNRPCGLPGAFQPYVHYIVCNPATLVNK